MNLPIRLGTEVTGVAGSFGSYVIAAGTGQHTALQVVIATGPFHRPKVPSVADGFDSAVTQLHTATTANPPACRPDRSWWSARATAGVRSPGNCPPPDWSI